MKLSELVQIYKQHGDLPLYFRNFDGNLVEAGCNYIHAFGVGFYKMIIPCDEMETVMPLGTGKTITRQKAQPGTLKPVVMFKDGLASDECDIPVYVKYFDAFGINPHSERCEVVDGKLVFFHDKEIWDAWLVEKERRDKERQERLKNMDIGKCEPRLPIIRNCEPTLLADKLVGVKPIEGPVKSWWSTK
jgi:hypothetical protein